MSGKLPKVTAANAIRVLKSEKGTSYIVFVKRKSKKKIKPLKTMS